MANTSIIKHPGRVEQITSDNIVVRIQVTDACAACHVKGVCGISGAVEKRVEIPHCGQAVGVGEEVHVILRPSSGLSAVGWAYVCPLALLLAILLLLPDAPFSDLYRAAAAVGGVALYYGILYAFREKWKKKYVFEWEKIK
jgi:sigma-E factor negative regulatory protein RseC